MAGGLLHPENLHPEVFLHPGLFASRSFCIPGTLARRLLHPEVFFHPGKIASWYCTSCHFCILGPFASPEGKWHLHPSPFSIPALLPPGTFASSPFCIPTLLHPGDFCIPALLHPGLFASRPFCIPVVLHPRDFCIPGTFASRRLLHPGLFTSRPLLHPGNFRIPDTFLDRA